MGHKLLALLLFLLHCPSCLQALCPPPPSVECKSNGGGCQIFNYQGIWEDRNFSRAAEAVSPKTEVEILHAVAWAVEKKQKIKVLSTLAHSLSKLVCVGDHGFIISIENYASVIGGNKGAMTITVQGGAMMRDFVDEDEDELKAVRLSLGTLGVISQVTFDLQPMFKRSLSMPNLSDDKKLENEAVHFLRAHDFTDLIWFPFHQKVWFQSINRVSVEVPGDGLNVGIGHFSIQHSQP